MELEIKEITDKSLKYDLYMLSLTWDNEDTYHEDKDSGIGANWLIQRTIAVYKDEELIGLGGIKNSDETKEICADFSAIVKPEYRRRGVADKLLKFMLEYCKE